MTDFLKRLNEPPRKVLGYVIGESSFRSAPPYTSEAASDPVDVPARDSASVAGIANLTHRLELALEQIEELHERVERLVRGDRAERDGG